MFDSVNRWLGGRPARRRATPEARQRRSLPRLEALETRLAPAVFNVNTTADLSITGGVNADGTIVGSAGTVTLRSAIQAANANSGAGGNTINLTRTGTYAITLKGTAGETDNLAGEFSIFPTAPNGNLTIVNMSGGAVAVDGGGGNRVFDINASNTTNPSTAFLVTMQGFTIQDGVASPGDLAPGTGGGIRDQGNQSVTLTNMVLTSNSSTADGGGLVMENTTNSSWTLTINNTTVSNNHAGDAGGGIDTDGFGTVVINGSAISGNTDLNQGAGVYIDSIQVGSTFISAKMNMTGTVVSNNQALATGTLGPPASGGSGGGISNAGNGAMTIANCTFANNYAGGVGGAFSDENAQGTLSVSNSVFSGNVAVLNGGAIQEGGPSTTLTNDSFQNNSSGTIGGALFANGTTLTVMSSTFAGNTAIAAGAAIEVQTTGTGGAASSVTNSTLTGNRVLSNASTGNGGGIDAPAAFTGALTLLNDTVNNNFADNGGGLFWAGNGTFGVKNTILAGNSASAAGPDARNTAGTFTDNGGNLIGSTSGNTGLVSVSTSDPRLGPLQNNGGPVIGGPVPTALLTEAPSSGSPAIDKGVAAGAPTTDERGFVRPDAGAGEVPDIGAFESQGAPPPSVSVAFGPFGEVLEVVFPDGTLEQVDSSGTHVLGGGVRSASVAFGPAGEVFEVVFPDGTLEQVDAFGTHVLGGGVRSASVAFGPAGEVFEVVFLDGTLEQVDAFGTHVLGGGVRSASVVFGPAGEVLEVVSLDGTLTQHDAGGAHAVAAGVVSASVAFDPSGAEVLDVIFQDGTLTQFDALGAHSLGRVF
jgi:hypothetical protein